jgi:hypothetical protein
MEAGSYRRMLVLSCTQQKRQDQGLLPAIERYDGPPFRVLRRYFREQPGHNVDAFVLSAKWGLIPIHHQIPVYDQRMTRERAQTLQPMVTRALLDYLKLRPVKELYLQLGVAYRAAIQGYETAAPQTVVVQSAGRTRGEALTGLRSWLYQTSSQEPVSLAPLIAPVTVRLCGIVQALSTEDALAIARQAVALGDKQATSYHAWFVEVDGMRISPKWLVGQMFGLQPGDFHTDQARRILRQLGVEARYQ